MSLLGVEVDSRRCLVAAYAADGTRLAQAARGYRPEVRASAAIEIDVSGPIVGVESGRPGPRKCGGHLSSRGWWARRDPAPPVVCAVSIMSIRHTAQRDPHGRCHRSRRHYRAARSLMRPSSMRAS